MAIGQVRINQSMVKISDDINKKPLLIIYLHFKICFSMLVMCLSAHQPLLQENIPIQLGLHLFHHLSMFNDQRLVSFHHMIDIN